MVGAWLEPHEAEFGIMRAYLEAMAVVAGLLGAYFVLLPLAV